MPATVIFAAQLDVGTPLVHFVGSFQLPETADAHEVVHVGALALAACRAMAGRTAAWEAPVAHRLSSRRLTQEIHARQFRPRRLRALMSAPFVPHADDSEVTGRVPSQLRAGTFVKAIFVLVCAVKRSWRERASGGR
jgi:hypothetical protein